MCRLCWVIQIWNCKDFFGNNFNKILEFRYQLFFKFCSELAHCFRICIPNLLSTRSVVRSSMGLAKQLNNLKTTTGIRSINEKKHRENLMNRSASLAIQTCVLNSFSLIVCCLSTTSWAISDLLTIGGLQDAAIFVFRIREAYFNSFQYAAAICSSNIGFFVHCYYSQLYREATVATFASLKGGIKRLFSRSLPTTLQNGTASNVVHPEKGQAQAQMSKDEKKHDTNNWKDTAILVLVISSIFNLLCTLWAHLHMFLHQYMFSRHPHSERRNRTKKN